MRLKDSEEPQSAQLRQKNKLKLLDRTLVRNPNMQSLSVNKSFQSFGKTIKINKESFKERIQQQQKAGKEYRNEEHLKLP